ncbi:hypothetical protein ACOQFO_01900 [Ureibacillus sp. MALMAid1270]|uniref:hypothetical protein n=1 Tax=Ureibacillus sp. MALMAid1270 TaxID=3411629 RepID=UPI003BA47581
MRIVILSFFVSIILHLVLFLSIFCFAYLKTHFFETKLYENDNIVVLQDEVVFGFVGTPLSIIFSIIGTATIVALMYLLAKTHKR